MSFKLENNRQLAEYKEILNEFLEKFDIKRIVAEYFMKGYKAGIFPNRKESDLLFTRFMFGEYKFQIIRLPRAAQQKPIDPNAVALMNAMQYSQGVLDKQKAYESNERLRRQLLR